MSEQVRGNDEQVTEDRVDEELVRDRQFDDGQVDGGQVDDDVQLSDRAVRPEAPEDGGDAVADQGAEDSAGESATDESAAEETASAVPQDGAEIEPTDTSSPADDSSPASDPDSEHTPSEPAAGAAPSPAAPSPAAPSPAALGKRRGQPRPRGPRAPQGPAAPAPAHVDYDTAEILDAAVFGRVDENGNVFVNDAGTERIVGQYPGVEAEQAMSLFIRRYLDLAAQVSLLETRIVHLTPKEAGQTHASLSSQLADAAAVGDLPALRTRLTQVGLFIEERREAARLERATAKSNALELRTALVERAEKLATQEPARTQWKASGDQMRGYLEEWKEAQRGGPRLDKLDEDALWKRFSAARTSFDKNRRQYFHELDAAQHQIREVKEGLISEAEALSSSTEWGPVSGKYRDLMDRWKAAGRASKKVDDELWARFRAAQQTFFDARTAANSAVDQEYAANLEVKLAILAEAEKLLPVTDLAATKSALRPLQDRWEEAGKVPRADVSRVEGRMRAVEQAVREADSATWSRTDPEKKARAEGALAQLEDSITALENDLAAAEAAGDERRTEKAREALAARRSWLDQIQRSVRG